MCPAVVQNLITVRNSETKTLQATFFNKTKFGKRAFVYYAPKYWNSLPVHLRRMNDINSFKTALKSYLLLHYDEFRNSIT